jgi:hypothetical protein
MPGKIGLFMPGFVLYGGRANMFLMFLAGSPSDLRNVFSTL